MAANGLLADSAVEAKLYEDRAGVFNGSVLSEKMEVLEEDLEGTDASDLRELKLDIL